MKLRSLATTLIVAACAAFPARAQTQAAAPSPAPAAEHGISSSELAVDVRNKSEPVLCAEKDNVALEFVSPAVRHFRIQAIHPAYINTIVSDRFAPDFTACDMTQDPSFKTDNARRVTFWETPDMWLVGYTQQSFWRPNTVPVRVGDKVEIGLHLVQLWVRYRERAEEVLVFYPPDGYWRIRPLPFADMRLTAYGSSFLLGPIEVQQRPIVALKEVAFDPATKTFTLQFMRGGSATLRLDSLDQNRIALEANMSGPMPADVPFAAMRSMYTTEFNADVAKIAWRGKGSTGWGETSIMNFKGASASEVWAGRTTPSIHNLSAPDMVFSHFSDKPAP